LHVSGQYKNLKKNEIYHFKVKNKMSGRGKASGGGKARAKAKTRSSKAGLQFPVVSLKILK